MTYNNGTQALTLDEVRAFAPSIFTETPYDKVSKNYRHISTANVLTALMEEDFQPFRVKQSRTRLPNKAPHVRHEIRLRKPSDKPVLVGDSAEEIVLTNSSDGTSAYNMYAGIFRLVCLNGMVVGDKTMQFRVLHKGDARQIAESVVETAYYARSYFTRIAEYRDRMSSVVLNEELKLALATEALAIKFGTRTPTLVPSQLLEARRVEDEGDSVWQVYNTVQENLTKGGLKPERVPGGRRTRLTRPIKSITEDISVNKSLWNAAVKIMEDAS